MAAAMAEVTVVAITKEAMVVAIITGAVIRAGKAAASDIGRAT